MFDDSPLVSIVVPIFKVEQYLDKCIYSIVNQKYKNIEIILVDDGSPDRCPAMCDEWEKRDLRISVIHKDNGGLSDARNAGIRYASGKYVYCVDSDDVIDPSLVQCAVDTACRWNADVVMFKFSCMKEDGTAISSGNNDNGFIYPESCFSSEQILEWMWKEKIPNYAWSFLALRSIYVGSSIDYPKDRLMEDLATTYKIISSANKIALINDSLYFYRMRSGSILDKKSPQLVMDYVTSIEEISRYSEENYPSLFVTQNNWAIKNLYTSLIWSYNIKNQFSGNDYKITKKRILRIINEYIKKIPFNEISVTNKIEFILSKFGLLAMMSVISRHRHENQG